MKREGAGVTPGELIFYPMGFNPQEAMREDDYGYSVGIKGSIAGWNWDLSGTYGKDRTARWDRFGRPDILPKYGASGFPNVWWWDAERATKVGIGYRSSENELEI